MSTQFNHVQVNKMVIISTSSNEPAALKASDDLQKLAELVLGKGILEEKSKSVPSVAEDGVKKNEQEENKQLAPTVMEAAGTPKEYSPEETAQDSEADGLINQAKIKEKCTQRQVKLGKISYNICTNNLTGLLTMRLFESDLDCVLCNMIDDSINVICNRLGNHRVEINYIT